MINMPAEQKNILDKLMTVFCSAVRFSFKRLLEGIKLGELEKLVAYKYELNIRQAKDAVENARQTIQSQRELVKLNNENTKKKVAAIEKQLGNDKMSERKRIALQHKLDKRKRKQVYWKNHIDNQTIPSVVFGTKEMFLKRCKGLITREEWQDIRSNRVYSRGDKTKGGNPNLRLVIEHGKTFLEISTLEKTTTNRAIKIRIPVYLPVKVSKSTGQVNGRDYKSMILAYLQTGEAYHVEVIRRNCNYYCHITIDEAKVKAYAVECTGHNGLIGIDTNPNGFALTMISQDGNYKWHIYLPQHELLYARSNRRKNLCGELAKKVVEVAKQNKCGVSLENLKFKDDKELSEN